jgi:flagellar transcriptional activator FlhD
MVFPLIFFLQRFLENAITAKRVDAEDLRAPGWRQCKERQFGFDFKSRGNGNNFKERMMKSTDTYNDIKEVNLAYLMLAQNMVRSDREAAVFRLGISEEIADILETLTPGQVLKMASSDMLLCSFRFDDSLLIDLLANHERDRGVGHIHAAILAAGKPVESVA